MQTRVALAFAWRLLNENQRRQIQRAWSELPRGRPLLPFEIGRILKIEITQTVKEEQKDSMNRTWIDFCREANIDQDSNPFDDREWLGWLDYAAINYCEPAIVDAKTDWNL